MPKLYEHLHVDISPRALAVVAAALEGIADHEVRNFANECRARLQHVAAGDPDISEAPTVPGRSNEGGWLDE